MIFLVLITIARADDRLILNNREKARNVLKIHCGACHYPEPIAANPKALRIFDLKQEIWDEHLSNKQLQALVTRLTDRSSMTAAELKEVVPRNAPTPDHPKPDEIDALRQFVSEALLNRSHMRRSGDQTTNLITF